MGTVAGVAAAVGIGKGLYEIGQTFDQMSDTIRVGTGATGAALEDLIAVAKDVGRTVPAEFSQIGTVVADLNTTLGYTGDDLQGVAEQVLQLSRITGQEVNISNLSSTLVGFGVSAEDAGDQLDMLYQISQATGAPVNDLTSALSTQGGILQGLGFDLTDSAALLGGLGKAGINASTVIKSMSAGLVKMAKDGEAPVDVFRRTVSELDSFIKSGDDAAALTQAGTIFGTRGAPQLIAALKSGKLNLDDMTAALGLTGDTIIGAAEETASFAEKWQVVKNNAAVAMEPLATTVFDALGDALAAMMPTLQAFGGWLEKNQWVIKAVVGALGGFLAWKAVSGVIGGVTGALKMLGSVASGIGSAISGLGSVMSSLSGAASTVGTALLSGAKAMGAWVKSAALATAATVKNVASLVAQKVALVASKVATAVATAAQWLWNAALTANPIGLIIAAIAALVAALVWFFTQTDLGRKIWQGFVDFLVGAWEWIKGAAEAVWGAITNLFTNTWTVIQAGAQALAEWWTNLWDGIGSFFTNLWNGLLDFVKAIPGKVLGFLVGLAVLPLRAAEWFGGVLKAAVTKLGEVVTWVAEIPKKILSALGNIGKTLFESGKSLVQGFLDGIKAVWDTLTGWVSKGMEGLRKLWPFSPAKEGPFSGKGWVLYSGMSVGEAFGEGIVRSLDDATARVSGALAPVESVFASAGPGDSGTVPGGDGPGSANSQIVIQNMTVRDESDIRRIAQELARLTRRDSRAIGVLA
jgi:TP901 family phage tail tape measure protein